MRLVDKYQGLKFAICYFYQIRKYKCSVFSIQIIYSVHAGLFVCCKPQNEPTPYTSNVTHTFVFQSMPCIHWKFLERRGCEPSGSCEVSWARRTGCQGLGAADAPYGRVIQTLLRIRHFLQQKVNGRKAAICLPVLSMKFNTLIPFKESKKMRHYRRDRWNLCCHTAADVMVLFFAPQLDSTYALHTPLG